MTVSPRIASIVAASWMRSSVYVEQSSRMTGSAITKSPAAHGMAMSAIVRTDDSDVAFASARSFLVSDAVIAGMTAMVIVGMNEQGSAKTVWQKL